MLNRSSRVVSLSFRRGVLFAMAMGGVLFTGCQEVESGAEGAGSAEGGGASEGSAANIGAGRTTLAAELSARAEATAARVPGPAKAVMEGDLERLRGLGLPATAIGVGDTAPGFTLAAAPDGREVSLASLLAEGPVVLMWYRGGWCPYCMIQLRHYQDRLAEFEAAGATVVALAPETPESMVSTIEKTGVGFALLSDAGNAVAAAYGISFRLGDPAIKLYDERFGLKLPAYNGDDSWTLPLPAVYVIDADGVVRYAFLEEDYRERAEPGEVLEVVKGL